MGCKWPVVYDYIDGSNLSLHVLSYHFLQVKVQHVFGFSFV